MSAIEINTNVFAIISDGGALKAGNVAKQKISTLEANGFQRVNHGEDFLSALSNDEYAIFLPKSEEDIQALYDEANIFSISYGMKEKLLHAYK